MLHRVGADLVGPYWANFGLAMAGPFSIKSHCGVHGDNVPSRSCLPGIVTFDHETALESTPKLVPPALQAGGANFGVDSNLARVENDDS